MTSFSRALSLAALWLISDSFSPVVQAQNISWQALPFSPPNFPLAVKSPYTSGWFRGYDKELAKQPSEFGTGMTLGWVCYVKVDNTTYKAMGERGANNDTVQTQAQFTPTRTIINSRAGPVDLVITFLSALDVSIILVFRDRPPARQLTGEKTNDLVRLSLPFSYLSVSAVSNDGGSHAVSDRNGRLPLLVLEWITSDTGDPAVWSTDANGSILIHQMSLRNPSPYWELQQRAQWGAVYLAANRTSGTTWQTGAEATVRSTFIKSGTLPNTLDADFRGVNDTWPIMAIAQDLGAVTTQAQVVTFTVGHSRDPAVKYFSEAGEQARSLYFRSKFSSEVDAVRYAVSDYHNASAASTEFDNRIQNDAARYSPDYASVVALATRQAFASIEITLNGTGPAADLQDIKLFTKDAAVDDTGVGRDGVLSSVDSLYSIMPMLIYTNPNLGNYALASFFEYPQTREQTYALHDLGSRYSWVLRHDGQRRNPVDGELWSTRLYAIADRSTMGTAATANMIIMTYAFMRYTGDAKLAAKHYYTLKAWADYLVSNALVYWQADRGLVHDDGCFEPDEPCAQGTDCAEGEQIQTGRAEWKIAERRTQSMVEIQDAVGMSNESSTYEVRWMKKVNAGGRAERGWAECGKVWTGTMDGAEQVGDEVQIRVEQRAAAAAAWARTQWATGTKSFGVPFNEQYSITSIPWQYFTLAAMITGDTSLLNSAPFAPIKNFASKAQNKIYGLADVYDTIAGVASPGYGLRGNVGGSYALLALG
ncbi:hypothetical protein RHS01_08842 [Rhizoctonia solani]|uniref:Uncharacterized protein n=1 Tax=Rhizoctonia solani TaxID=456999 RepID=A0A8H7I707_9AGAM|nr:hypothetical protein RHS01_08842 [Rhizoctonia solani]